MELPPLSRNVEGTLLKDVSQLLTTPIANLCPILCIHVGWLSIHPTGFTNSNYLST